MTEPLPLPEGPPTWPEVGIIAIKAVAIAALIVAIVWAVAHYLVGWWF